MEYISHKRKFQWRWSESFHIDHKKAHMMAFVIFKSTIHGTICLLVTFLLLSRFRDEQKQRLPILELKEEAFYKQWENYCLKNLASSTERDINASKWILTVPTSAILFGKVEESKPLSTMVLLVCLIFQCNTSSLVNVSYINHTNVYRYGKTEDI